MFGFSRGAYTVRVLAALLDVIGLLAPDQSNLAGYALSAYKRSSADSRRGGQPAARPARSEALEEAWQFGRSARARPVGVEFIGVWDTVASVIVPRGDRQVWFAGVHVDIGGGYPEVQSGLSKFPLAWMVEQAMAKGLLVDAALFRHMALGEPRPGGRHTYAVPDPKVELHDSMTAAWRIMEFVPELDFGLLRLRCRGRRSRHAAS